MTSSRTPVGASNEKSQQVFSSKNMLVKETFPEHSRHWLWV